MESDDLKARVSILQILKPYVDLTQHGAEWQGKCPFHEDSTPSFSVNPEKGVYCCYGCGAKGDIYNFIQEKHHVDFREAKRIIAERAGLNLADFDKPPADGAPRPVSTPESKLTDKPQAIAYYPYVDEKGILLYEIVRKEWLEGGERKKTFLQRWHEQGAPADVFVWRKHQRQVVFRLDKVLAADVVWFVEGEKDAMSLEAIGLVATTIAGGSNAKWLLNYTQALTGKQIRIIPDNDAPGQKFAQRAYDKLSPVASVVIVRVPGPPKSDVSDWLADGGTVEALRELARVADEAAEAASKQAYIGPKREPNELAREILEKHSFVSDEAGFLYEYNKRFWEQAPKDRLRRYAMIHDSEHHTNQRRRSEVADFIATHVQVPKVPWRQLSLSEVPVENGVIDVRTKTLRPHQREDYLEAVIPVAYDPGADCPTWLRCLWDYFGHDEDCAMKCLALQEFFGYVLLPHAKYKKALILLGESDSGKTEPLKLIENLVGPENTCSVGVESMDDPRARVPIVGKMLNKLSELSADAVIADGGFKTLISTQEAILIDPKFVAPYMYSPYAKHIIVTNKLPAINDLTKATYNRLLVLHFSRVIPIEKQDRGLTEKLQAELPGVLNWALEGARDLVDQGGQFTEIPESKRLVEQYRREENEINAFLDEKSEKVEGSFVYASSVRQRFRSWASRSTSDKVIGRMMASAGYPSTPWPGDPSRRHNGLRWLDSIDP